MVKNVMRLLSLACIVFGFCPAFLVSCSGENQNITVWTAVKGIEDISSPHPELVILWALPVVILALLFLYIMNAKTTALVVLACSVIDIAVWFAFKTGASRLAEQYMCTFDTTIWFTLNIIALAALAVVSALSLLGVVAIEEWE